jgi:hypothetical protein
MRHIFRGNQVQPYLNPTIGFFDRASVPPEISELLDEWREIDPATARLIRAAVSSRDQPRLRCVWAMLASLAEGVRLNGSPRS